MPVTIRFDARPAIKRLQAVQKQIPFATAKALTDIAFQVMRAENENIAKVFENPGRWTRTAVQVEKKARSDSLVAIVSTRDGRSYLTPYETGGVHVLPATKSPTGGTLFNPKAVRLQGDNRKNGGTIADLLARRDVFKGTVHGVRGIWQRLPKGHPLSKRLAAMGYRQVQLRLLIRFGDALPVKKHLGFAEVAVRMVVRTLPMAFERALAEAMRTAK